MKRLLVIIGISTVSQAALAQWRYTLTISAGSSPTVINCGPYFTKAECEQNRLYDIAANTWSSYIGMGTGRGGRITVKATATPCSGPAGNVIGSVDILGVSKGNSFYTSNPVNEIQNWSSDDMERVLALDANRSTEQGQFAPIPDSKYQSALVELNGKKYFRSLNVGEDGLINTQSADLATPKVMAADEILVAEYISRVDMTTAPKLPMASTDEYVSWIKEQFKLATGCNIDDIIAIPSRTAEQSELMRNYREFEARLLNDAISQLDKFLLPIEQSHEKKEIDMAVVALDCYGEDKDYIYKTDYRRLELDRMALNEPMRKLMEKLEEYNQTFNETGFHAVLYQNDKTGEFAFAFEGSAFPGIGLSSNNTLASKIAPDVNYDEESKSYIVNAFGLEVKVPKDLWADWGENNVRQTIGMIGKQFQMAKEIGDFINSVSELRDANINFTGHSLGGGLASIAGLVTGKPTYTFNAEGVSTKILENYGLLGKVNSGEHQITAYHTNNDPLTQAQQTAQKKMSVIAEPLNMQNQYAATAIGTEVNIGEAMTTRQNYIDATVGTVAGGMAGTKELLNAVKDYGALGLVYGFCKGVEEGRKTAESASKAYSMLYGHQMSGVVGQMIKRNSTTQSLWERMNNEKRAMNREMDHTRMRSLEQVYILTD